ncbi:terpene synthase family protein [Allokutzneria sp. NRRL B-24872]|uniref:terpene synthase family protein n=1 Tax=Allokutzneria sp. NRRL B-24872 TaxID=1137961 RepID=UPI000A3D62CA|nr:terpene synthase family protein [Allokutzneria sp. NRRL B-24872]
MKAPRSLEALMFPMLDIPFSSTADKMRHPDAEVCEAELLALLDTIDPALRESSTIRGVPLTDVTSRTLLRTSREGLLIGMMCGILFYIHDDWFDACDEDGNLLHTPEELNAVHARADVILHGGPSLPGDVPPIRFLELLWRRATAFRPDRDQRRLRRAVQQWLWSHLWEHDNMRRNLVPSFDAFNFMRVQLGAMAYLDEFDSLIYHIDVPDEVMEHPVVELLLHLSRSINVWMHDFYAFEKHRSAKTTDTSLVITLRNELDCSDQEAVNAAAEKINRTLHDYRDLKSRLPHMGIARADQLERLLQRQEEWIANGRFYHLNSIRYTQPHANETTRRGG